MAAVRNNPFPILDDATAIQLAWYTNKIKYDKTKEDYVYEEGYEWLKDLLHEYQQAHREYVMAPSHPAKGDV